MVNTLAWTLAVLFYGVGDAVITYIGTQFENIEESVPTTRWLIGSNPSIWALAALKVVSLALVFIAYLFIEGNRYRDLVPISLALLGLYAVIMNSYTIREELRSF
jgi:hypothetical protein